jgi:ABC-type dipeptide/oligopeptide/nickel transport system permease subunit
MKAFPLFDLSMWKRFAKNRSAIVGLVVISLFVVLALLPGILAPHRPDHLYPGQLRLNPFWGLGGSFEFPLGTDDVGRDLFSRLIYGARVSLGVGFFVVLISTFLGTILGLLAGYFSGFIDRMIMRLVDIIMALPSILLAIVVVSILGPGLNNAVIAVSIVAIPNFIRIVRASVIAEKSKDYVGAAQSLGAGHFRILVLNIFPNCLAPLIVQATLAFSDGILNTAALGFLGLGAQPPTAEWGTMLADARPFIESSPWLVTFPGICILLVVLGFNLMGDGLRDALDPKLR